MFDRIAHQRLFLPTVTLAACGGLFSFLVFYNPDRAYYFLFSGLTLTILVTYTFWLFSLKKIKEKSRFTERRATAELEALVDTAVDGILAISKNGLIERFNPAAEKLFGYDKSEVIGRNVKILMPASYADEHDDYLHQYEATGIKKIIGIGRTVTGKRKDDTEFPMELSVGELPEPLNGYVGIIRDITERQYFEQSIKRATAEQAALVDTAVDAILSISENGNIERFNPAAE
ncbi:MAG: PAS domain S-box protein, partial [Sneathiella sp.]